MPRALFALLLAAPTALADEYKEISKDSKRDEAEAEASRELLASHRWQLRASPLGLGFGILDAGADYGLSDTVTVGPVATATTGIGFATFGGVVTRGIRLGGGATWHFTGHRAGTSWAARAESTVGQTYGSGSIGDITVSFAVKSADLRAILLRQWLVNEKNGAMVAMGAGAKYEYLPISASYPLSKKDPSLLYTLKTRFSPALELTAGLLF